MGKSGKGPRLPLSAPTSLLIVAICSLVLRTTTAFIGREYTAKIKATSPTTLRVGATLPSHFGANATYSYDHHLSLSRGFPPAANRAPKVDARSDNIFKPVSSKHQNGRPSSMLVSSSNRNGKRVAYKLGDIDKHEVAKPANPIQRVWLFLTQLLVPQQWIDYPLTHQGESSRPAKRIPLFILLFKAANHLFSPKSSIQKKKAAAAAAVDETESEMIERFMHEAQTHLYSDPVVRAAVGFPMEVISSSNKNNHQNNTLLTQSARAIRVHGQKVYPLEMSFRVRGSRTSGVVIAMATCANGIVKLTLHIMEGSKGRVIPVNILKRSLPIRSSSSSSSSKSAKQ